MYIHCNVTDCVHWSAEGSDFFCDAGGCTLKEITIDDNEVTAAGCLPQCRDYEERND